MSSVESVATFTNEDALSDGIEHAMTADEGIALVNGRYGSEDVDLDLLESYEPDSEQFRTAAQDQFELLIDRLRPISETAKQKIIDTQLGEFPLDITTADIGLVRLQVLSKDEGKFPHIDQQDRQYGENWLPPNLYTGVSISLPLTGSAEWRTWFSQDFGVLDNFSTKNPLPLIRKPTHPGGKNTEVVTDESGLVFVQSVGDLVIIRQGDVLHRVRQIKVTNERRLRVMGDVTLMISPSDLSIAEFREAKEWAHEQRWKFLHQAVVRSAVRLEPVR